MPASINDCQFPLLIYLIASCISRRTCSPQMSSMSVYHVYLISLPSHSNQSTSSCLHTPLSLPAILPIERKALGQFAGDHSLPEIRDRNHHCILFKEPHQKRKKKRKEKGNLINIFILKFYPKIYNELKQC